jgi:hypothetical protein
LNVEESVINRNLINALVLVCLPIAALATTQSGGTLKGKIEDEKGKPIAGAEVRAMRSRDRSLKETRTDEAGTFPSSLYRMTTP